MAGSSALGNALSGILTSRRALDVTSQNVSNASNENYSRQKAIIKSNKPLQIGTLSVGTGANVSEITRARDELLDVRFRQENQTFSRFKQLDQVFSQIEGIVNEPSEDGGIRNALSQFDSAMQDLANDPENRGARTAMIGKAQDFANILKRVNSQLQQIGGQGGGGGQNSADAQIEGILSEVNNAAEEIASLNLEINAIQASGGNPNDLLDQRNALVEELSGYADISVEKEKGLFRVNFSGYTLVQGGETHEISLERRNGENQLIYDNPTESTIDVQNGKLKALFEIKNEVVPKVVDQLNDLTVQFIDRFNDIHKTGFGLDGQTNNNFFEELPTTGEGVFRLEGSGDRTGGIAAQRAGYIDSPGTRLVGNRDGNSPDGPPENFELDSGILAPSDGPAPPSGNQIGAPEGTLQINNSVINYDMSEDSMNDIIERINSTDNKAEAYLSAENRLVIKGAQEADYELNELRDTGMLLEKSNLLTVGGSDRTAKNDAGNTATNLLAGTNFGGDFRIDGTVQNNDGTGSAMDLAEGTLEFESTSPNPTSNFNVNYDARQDSLEDLVERINRKANNKNSKVAAEVTPDDRLRVFASKTKPDSALDPGVSADPEARFAVNDRASQQLSADTSAGGDPLTNVSVNNTAGFQEGDVVSISDDTGQTEKAVVRNVASPTQLDLHVNNTFNNADNPTIEGPNASTAATATFGGGADVGQPINVQDATQFEEGEAVIFEDFNTGPEKVIVKGTDNANDTITVNLDNQYTGGGNTVTGNTGSVRKVQSNEKRNLLNVLGMDRLYDSNDDSTEFAITGESKAPPIAEQVAGIEVNSDVLNNPDLIAAAAGDDVDADGVNESSKGSGNGEIMQELSNLRERPIMESGTKSVDGHIGETVAELGSDAQLVSRERSASRSLVQNINQQIQSESGVSLDEEMTNLLRQQQAFQANARVLSSVRTVTNAVLNLV